MEHDLLHDLTTAAIAERLAQNDDPGDVQPGVLARPETMQLCRHGAVPPLPLRQPAPEA